MGASKGRHLARSRRRSPKRLAWLTVLAMALTTLPAVAGAVDPYQQTIWGVGNDDGLRDEFSAAAPSGGYQCDGKVFEIGVHAAEDLAQLGRSSSAAAGDPRYANSCGSIVIQFDVTDTWTDTVLKYARAGGEKTEARFRPGTSGAWTSLGSSFPDSDSNNVADSDGHPFTDYFYVPGALTPGTYQVELRGLEQNSCAGGEACAGGLVDGYFYIDYIGLTGNRAPTVDLADGPHVVPLGADLSVAASDPDVGDSVNSCTADHGSVNSGCDSWTADTVGVFDVTITATDQNGASGSDTESVVVYDPSGGFATGGGWYDSPIGAAGPVDGDGIVEANGDDNWAWNQDPPFVTEATLTDDYASTGTGSLGVDPITNDTNAEKFILRHVPTDPIPTADFESFSIDFLIDPNGSNTSHNQFYLNVYTYTPNPDDGTTWYDCRFDYVAASGLTTEWTTLTADSMASATAVGDGLAGACPGTINGMPAGSVIAFISVNLGDTSASDTGIGGYFDNAQLTMVGGSQTWDFEVSNTIAGKASFGFVSKYKKGADTPDGNTQFTFNAAGISLHSTSYDWLVVNQGGTNAQFKGSADVNGVAGYQFMIWASDGSPDTFRIKIWHETSGDVIYDNDAGTPLGGGSIVIHDGKGK